VKGPVFTQVLLADEVNRTPPKTQAALLEAMEERQVTIDGETHWLGSPFFVLGTQNPIEQEGTYPLPEAQMDRFMLKLSTGYAQSLEEESAILTRRIQWKKDDPAVDVPAVIDAVQFAALQETIENQIYIDKSILDFVSAIVRATRQHPKVEIGASPRGGLSLLKVSRAAALINGRDFVTPDDIKMFTTDALAHRTILKIEESLEGANPRSIIEEIVESIPAPLEFSPR
jgi:MoxR-like ATPase